MQLFKPRGVHCVVDGQFGSTGKGLLSSYLADRVMKNDYVQYFGGAIYSGGPNSGHTSYFEGRKIVLKQLPTFSVHLSLHDIRLRTYLSAGAVIDRDVLKQEAEEYPNIPIFVHPNAAIVTDEDKKSEESGSIAEVAGTRSGTGATLARKVLRISSVIARNSLGKIAPNVVIQDHRMKPERNAYFMEIAQGFSLGINSHFYPKVTSRECTVAQGLADARIAPAHVMRTYMAIRSYPIRVGNVDGYSSGDWYNDQVETNWESLGVEPELTTVTKRVRRIATFSMDQFSDACHANRPDIVFISHMDYLPPSEQRNLLDDIKEFGHQASIKFDILVSFGPHINNVHQEEDLVI
jgi:adenylosuccinate synthase